MPAIKSIVPAAFFDVEMSLKAQESVVVKLTLLGYGLVTIALGALLTFEFSNKVFSQGTNFSVVPLDGWDCNALGVWSNKAQSLERYIPYQATNGMEVMIDASLTSRQCTAKTEGVCARWAFQFSSKFYL